MGKVHIVFGPQGAGKSTYSKSISQAHHAVHMSIDEWMWKLFGQDMPSSMNLKWIMERVERCENHIWSISQQVLKNGGSVILDLGFTKRAKRKSFQSLCEKEGFDCQLHYVHAPHAIRRERVLQRNIDKGDTFSFEVTPGMFDFMETEFHSATEAELAVATVIETFKP